MESAIQIPPAKDPMSKMMYLIRRRPETSRDELVANWFANHMPDVIASQHAQAEKGRPRANRYVATLFKPPANVDHDERPVWDGVAQLWWDEPLPVPSEPHGTPPRDTFQQKAEPYMPWPTTEYLVIDGQLPVEPNTLNQPYPCTRSGFVKITALIAAKPDIDYDEFRGHWLGAHAKRVAESFSQAGGLRYVISLGDRRAADRYAGMAELYFPDGDAIDRYRQLIQADGQPADDMAPWVDREAGATLLSDTEMVGIP